MSDAVVEGDVIAKGAVTISGRVQGSLSAQTVEISETGEVYGTLKAQSADVRGAVQGEVAVRGLIRIGKTGTVNGKVQYGSIAMEQGASLDATLRNIPPHLSGDFQLTVDRGGFVTITTLDITAFDPDDAAKDLTYSVSNASNGFVALASARATPVASFTQADVEGSRVIFVHDGGSAAAAGFDTQVTDAKGATSGAARRVNVAVKG